jgi:hypothetical protein
MPSLSLDVGDAAELSEMLQFVSGWLAADRLVLGLSLAGTGARAGLCGLKTRR